MEMQEKIRQYLRDFEDKYDVKVLHACETGSRAWGFPSPDSDYDVRVIYKHRQKWYLTLQDRKDSIDYFLENRDMDISAWELRKSLRLMYKSNAPLFERFQSPIVYAQNEEFMKELSAFYQKAYSRIAFMHHYLGMAKKPLSDVTEAKEFRLKHFFYALRSLLCCYWILERQDLPPMQLQALMQGLPLPLDLVEQMQRLVEVKFTAPESYMHTGEKDLLHFMQQIFERSEKEGPLLPSARFQLEELNELFYRNVCANDY